MANEIGTSLVSSLTNSSFDIANMSKVLAEAEVAGPRSIIEKGKTKTTTELEAIKYLQTNLEAFNTYAKTLSSAAIFNERSATSSDTTTVSVTATSAAALGAYQVESKQLAQAHTQVANTSFLSTSDTISMGTLQINVGGQTHNITVDATNNTVDGLQKVINSGNYGVNAAVINNGGTYQLMFTSDQVGAAGEVTLSGLASLDAGGYTTTADAQDAVMVLNGLTISNSTNTFDNVVDGVTFQLNATQPGAPKSVSIGQSTDKVVEAVQSFVDVYNQLNTILGELGSYDTKKLTQAQKDSPEFQYFGDLAGSSLLRSVRDQVKQSMTGSIAEINSSYNTLAMVGISTDLKGQMQIDHTVFDNLIATDMSALSNLFSKGGSTNDTLVNYLGGSDRTLTGSYALDVTQFADRATVTGGAATLTTNERVAGGKVVDANTVLDVAAGAAFDINVNGAGPLAVSLTAGSYLTKADVATEMQTQINAALTLAGQAAAISVAYDSVQSRFELTSTNGSVAMSNVTGLTNQGFTGTAYNGSALLDLSAGPSTFDVKVDASVASTVTIAQGMYTMDELAYQMTTNINTNPDVIAAAGGVSVSHDGSAFTVTSNKFGGYSSIDLTNFSANFANTGFTANLTDVGQSVDGTITTPSGTLNIGAYADPADGRVIKISDFAMVGTTPAEVRGLSFEVLGGATGPRGNITFAQGFASRIQDSVTNLFNVDTGLISKRIESLTNKNIAYDERTKVIDDRYTKIELKYRLQFSMLQSIMSQSQATRSQLSAQFNNGNKA